jgi:hypothetical protein
MAETNGTTDPANDTVLLAFLTVHLESGESFELLPFEDAEDVKAKVSNLMKAWAKSGFLIRGSQIYPWHQVRRIEATSVEELSRADARLRRQQWETRDTAHLQQSFWKTKKAHPDSDQKDSEGSEGGEESGGHSQAAA